jgi:hypothetical protein
MVETPGVADVADSFFLRIAERGRQSAQLSNRGAVEPDPLPVRDAYTLAPAIDFGANGWMNTVICGGATCL